MIDVSVSVPSDLITAILQSFLGQGYINAISIGFQALLIGYIFLSYRFVIRGKNKYKDWNKINQIDKLVISFFLGFGLLLVGVISMLAVIIFFTKLNLLESLTKVYANPNIIVYSFIFVYSFFLIYDPRKLLLKKKYDIFNQIEKYFAYLAELFFVLIGFLFLSLLSFEGVLNSIIWFVLCLWLFHRDWLIRMLRNWLEYLKTNHFTKLPSP